MKVNCTKLQKKMAMYTLLDWSTAETDWCQWFKRFNF